MIRRYLPKSTEELIHWYERYISPFALVGGFLLDNFIFLDRIDSLQSYLLISTYVLIAAAGIVLFHTIERGRLRGKIALTAAPFIPLAIQFAFGALFSGFLAVYWRSASVAVSWIFVLGIAALLLGNERFRSQYMKLPFQASMLFTVIFSFFIFLLPILLHRIGSGIFILGGIASLLATAAFLYLIKRLVPDTWAENKTVVARSLAIIYVVFNLLYFTNAIPPLPLALKDAGVYHSAIRAGDTYVLHAEPVPWYKRYLRYNTLFTREPGAPAYVFSAIYAPKNLKTGVVHEWQRKADDGTWVTESTIPFAISGGREEGYRAYSTKSSLSDGPWRVNVLTKNGQVIGRVSFTVVSASSTPALVEVRR